eukprot:GDKH01025878.1.p1 GENE.GDKH01025878.1~~GDKH01025878.1.p1  ORF type:complete len:86 (+),score=22.20 GDKH01025878.1:3-260(+)
MMVGMSGFKGSSELILKMIGSALDMIVHIGRRSDGMRRVMQISELKVIDNEIRLKDIFRFDDDENCLKRIEEAEPVPLLESAAFQ